MDYLSCIGIGLALGGLIGMMVCHVDKDKAFNEGLEFGEALGRAFADKERRK